MSDNNDIDLSLVDLVGRETLDAIRSTFEACVGMPLLFTDSEGRPVTEVEDPTRFCFAFLQGSPEAEAVGCLCCERATARERTMRETQLRTQHTGEPVIETCPMGFLDAVVPIELQGQVLGYGLFGRALDSVPDLEQYRRMAKARGLDPEACVTAAENATVMSREDILSVAKLLHTIAGLVVRAANDTLQARQVQELEKTRDDLTHMIVHDLRTPLTAIIGSLRSLYAGSLGPLDDPVKEFVELSLRNAKRLLGLVNDLLDVDKIQAEGIALNREPVQLRSIVDAAVEQVHYLVEDRDIALATELPPDLPALYVDREKVDRVLVNLLGNAIKFTPRGGAISIVASHSGEDEDVLVAVEDTGEGIPEEYLEKVFDRFAQVESRQAGRKMSTGLGLTFCKMAVEAHGGRIWVESKLGEGTTFFFTLPTP